MPSERHNHYTESLTRELGFFGRSRLVVAGPKLARVSSVIEPLGLKAPISDWFLEVLRSTYYAVRFRRL